MIQLFNKKIGVINVLGAFGGYSGDGERNDAIVNLVRDSVKFLIVMVLKNKPI